MSSYKIRRLIVVDSTSNMIGIISDKDILRRIAKERQLVTEFFGSNYNADNKEIFRKITEFDLSHPPKI